MSKPPECTLIPVHATDRCAGHLRRTAAGFLAYDRDDRIIGIFTSTGVKSRGQTRRIGLKRGVRLVLSFAAKNWLVNANPLCARHNMSLGRRAKKKARQFDLTPRSPEPRICS